MNPEYEIRLAKYKARHLDMCDVLLTKANVPEWVMLQDSNGVPANSVPARLEWYLARRKDITTSEAKQGHDADMARELKRVKLFEATQAEKLTTPNP